MSTEVLDKKNKKRKDIRATFIKKEKENYIRSI